MPEGVAVAGRVVSGGVYDDPDSPPPLSADAPKGWTWDRGSRAWKPKVRGATVWPPPASDTNPYPPTRPLSEVLGQQEGPPPDANPDYGRDPAPGWTRDEPQEAKPGGRQLSFEEVPQEVKNDIAGLGGLVATPILALARTVDPYCGGALADSFEGVMDATLPLICRSERIVRYFTEDQSDWLMWGKLAITLAPVGKAIAEHHIFRTVEVRRDEKTGQVTILRTTAGADGGHLTPPVQPEYDASQYAA